jgi:LysR family transcriptional regulator, low CO2-responsive transcriptional regulator
MLHLTLRQLSVFDAVARLGGYSRAAQGLHMTQPAVSMQIKQLEDNAGMPLFEQLGKRIYLTDAGRELLHYSRSILAQLNEADAVLSELRGLRRGTLKIAVASTANYFLPRLLAAFDREYHAITVQLTVSNRETLLNQLANNDTDLAIMGRPPTDTGLVAKSFMDNPLVVIASPGHTLAQEQQIPLEWLQDETFLMREVGSGTRMAMERFFTEHGIQLTAGMEMNSNEAIKQAVQAGLGLGLVSLHTLEMELLLKRLIVLDVQNLPIMRHWYIVHREGKRFSSAARAFIDFLLGQGREVLSMDLPKPPVIPTATDAAASV